MRFTVQELMKRGVGADRIHISMERNMKCAVGLCGHCQYGPQFVCKDGPVFRYDTVDRAHSVVSYWTIDGVHLGDLPLATGFPTGLSPSGTYISYLQATNLSAGDMVVSTLDGLEVARTHLPFMDLHPVWMSDGAMMFCQHDASFVGEHQGRWDLFSPQRPFIPGDPFQSCLLDAR